MFPLFPVPTPINPVSSSVSESVFLLSFLSSRKVSYGLYSVKSKNPFPTQILKYFLLLAIAAILLQINVIKIPNPNNLCRGMGTMFTSHTPTHTLSLQHTHTSPSLSFSTLLLITTQGQLSCILERFIQGTNRLPEQISNSHRSQ